MVLGVVRTDPARARRTSGPMEAVTMPAVLAWSSLLDDREIFCTRGGSVGHVGVRRWTERGSLRLDRALTRALRGHERLVVHLHGWGTPASPRWLLADASCGTLSCAWDPVRSPTFRGRVIGAYMRILRPATAVVADGLCAVAANLPVATGFPQRRQSQYRVDFLGVSGTHHWTQAT